MSDHQFLTLSLIRQFLKDEKYHETLHVFEKESKFHFDKNHVAELGMKGKWDEVEKYVSAFIPLDHRRYSMDIYSQIWKQMYIEALERKDIRNAVKILQENLKHIEILHPPLYTELTKLLSMDDFRKHPMLLYYRDRNYARVHVVNSIIKMIDIHPHLREKLVLPNLGEESALKNLLEWHKNQSHGSSSSRPPTTHKFF